MEPVNLPAIEKIQDRILQRQKNNSLTEEDIALMQDFTQIFRMLDEYYQLKEMYEEGRL